MSPAERSDDAWLTLHIAQGRRLERAGRDVLDELAFRAWREHLEQWTRVTVETLERGYSAAVAHAYRSACGLDRPPSEWPAELAVNLRGVHDALALLGSTAGRSQEPGA